MKKLKPMICVLLLSTCLTGNVFAGDFTGTGVFSFLGSAINAVVSLLRPVDPCEGRICTNCKPGSGGSTEHGLCRPNDN